MAPETQKIILALGKKGTNSGKGGRMTTTAFNKLYTKLSRHAITKGVQMQKLYEKLLRAPADRHTNVRRKEKHGWEQTTLDQLPGSEAIRQAKQKLKQLERMQGQKGKPPKK